MTKPPVKERKVVSEAFETACCWVTGVNSNCGRLALVCLRGQADINRLAWSRPKNLTSRGPLCPFKWGVLLVFVLLPHFNPHGRPGGSLWKWDRVTEVRQSSYRNGMWSKKLKKWTGGFVKPACRKLHHILELFPATPADLHDVSRKFLKRMSKWRNTSRKNSRSFSFEGSRFLRRICSSCLDIEPLSPNAALRWSKS